MTDFLGRLAARAVGAGTSARPRLAGLFEPAGSRSDATLEVVEGEVVAPAPESQRKEAPGAAERGRQAAPLAAAPPAEVAHPPNPLDMSAEPRAAALPDVVARSNHVPAPAHAIRAHEPEPELVPADPLEQSVPVPVVAAAPLAQALPVVATREAAPPQATAPARAEEPPPVRVHIGRLEVRANVQPPAPERPRRESARPDGLSLADYLRGKREVEA